MPFSLKDLKDLEDLEQPYFYKSNEYEVPFVMTKEILLKVFDKELKELNNEPKLDLGYNVPIFSWFTNKRVYIAPEDVLNYTEYVLLNIANAYKYFNDKVLKDILEKEVEYLRNQSLGNLISSEIYSYIVNQSIINKDTIKVKPNSTIRFLKNPYYKNYKNEADYKKDVNRTINKEITDKNYCKIYNAIIDYDLNKERLNKTLLSTITDLSIKTIDRYFNNNIELKKAFDAIKLNSGTKLQFKKLLYNLKQLEKKQSA